MGLPLIASTPSLYPVPPLFSPAKKRPKLNITDKHGNMLDLSKKDNTSTTNSDSTTAAAVPTNTAEAATSKAGMLVDREKLEVEEKEDQEKEEEEGEW